MNSTNGPNLGVTRYFELNERLIHAHRRVVAGMGAEQFKAQVLDQFGLVLDDDMVIGVASGFGWQSTWISGSRAKASAPPPSRDITAMLNPVPVPSLSAVLPRVPPRVVSALWCWVISKISLMMVGVIIVAQDSDNLGH